MHKSDQEESAQKQARKARAEHLVKCRTAPGKKNVRRKPLSELYVNWNFTEDREEWQREVQRHCEEVYCTYQEETREVQQQRIDYSKKKCDQQFPDDGRGAEITIDLVPQARAKMSEIKVNGPEDVVSEMIKQLPLEKICIITRCFQERFMGQMEAPSSWKIVETGCS